MFMIYINLINNKNVSYKTSHTGHRFARIRLPYPGSLNGWMTITCSIRDVFKCKTSPDTHMNLRLGESDADRKASICVDTGYGPYYTSIRISNQEIFEAYLEDIRIRTQQAAGNQAAA